MTSLSMTAASIQVSKMLCIAEFLLAKDCVSLQDLVVLSLKHPADIRSSLLLGNPQRNIATLLLLRRMWAQSASPTTAVAYARRCTCWSALMPAT